MVLKKFWSVAWRVIAALTALAFVVLVALINNNRRYWLYESLSEHVEARDFFNKGEMRIYNDSTGTYTLKGADWVVKAKAGDSLSVFSKDRKRGFINVKTGEALLAGRCRRQSSGKSRIMTILWRLIYS